MLLKKCENRLHCKRFSHFCNKNNSIYYIQSSEIQENIVDISCIFYIFTSENIKSYIFTPPECTYNFFWITSDFSIDLLLCTSELQTPITFLFVNENIKCGYSFS